MTPLSLTPRAETLLQEILDHRLENGNCDISYWAKRFDNLNFADGASLRNLFKQLSDANMIQAKWSAGGPWMIIVLDNAYSYFEQKEIQDKEKAEAKRMADQATRREKAATIISGQPIVGSIRLMDSNAEEMLQVILAHYDGNEKRYVSGDSSMFPEACAFSLDVEFEKLYLYGVTSEAIINILGEWSVYLTSNGMTYFADKERAIKKLEDKSMIVEQRKQYDVFLSHASKDKSDYVESLYMVLRRLGISIFYDSDSISWGDNWKRAILEGTAVSEFAIIVISENYFDREWTERELKEFLQRQNESGQKIVLPLLHGVSRTQMNLHYPELTEIQVIDTGSKSKEDIAILFAKELIKRYR